MKRIETTVDLGGSLFPNIGDSAEIFVGHRYGDFGVIGWEATLHLTDVHPADSFPSFCGRSALREGKSVAIERAKARANAYLNQLFCG